MKLIQQCHVLAANAVLVAVLGIVMGVGTASAQPIPANLAEPRAEHTATSLASGKVLIAGGNGNNGRIAGTTLYDPDNNIWTMAGDLSHPRFLHTATLLADGTVLVVGGTDGTALRSAEIFDTTTGNWTDAGSLTTGRYSHTATLLPNGRVLVVGGNTDSGVPAATAELYDPSSKSWMVVPGPALARYAHTATLLDTGDVLIVGGQIADGVFIATAERYISATNAWTMAGSLTVARASHVATLLQDGSVDVEGGDAVAPNVPRERYDPSGDIWTATGSGSGSAGYKLFSATLLNSGKVLFAGGYLGGYADTDSGQLDPIAGTRSPLATMPTARWDHTATLLPSGRVLVVGGYNPQLGYLARVALYDPATDRWAAQEGFSAPRNVDSTFAVGGLYAYRPTTLHDGTTGILSDYSTRQIIALARGGVLALGDAYTTTVTSPYGVSATFALTATGTLDQSYGQGGNLLPHSPFDLIAVAARGLSDGSLVVASEAGCLSFSDCANPPRLPTYNVKRYLANGTLDTTYGASGTSATASYKGNAAILSDGTVVSLGDTMIAGASQAGAAVVDASGHANPALAAQFLAQMLQCYPKPSGDPMVEATSDDKVVVAFGACMMRLNNDGTPDATFGGEGVSTIDNAGLPVTRVLVQKDGGTLAFSSIPANSTRPTSYRVVKRLPNGFADPNFGSDGVIANLQPPFTPVGASAGLALGALYTASNSRGFPALDAKDRVLIAGTQVDGVTSETTAYLARYDAQMNLDPSFGATGTGLIEIGNRAFGPFVPASVTTDRWGRVVVAGQMSYRTSLTSVRWSEAVTRVISDTVVTPVVEFYNAALDHYFITWVPDEIAKLDAGTEIKGWVRTGYSFNAFTATQPEASPVCRFYIPPSLGDSHFFGRGTAECDSTGEQNPSFVLESPNFMYVLLPSNGVCPDDTSPIYRVFSNRADANHRYITDKVLRDRMVAKGWLAEGDGPDPVVMCGPQ